MGQIIKSFCVCACVRVCVCVRLWTLSRSHFFVDSHQIGHFRPKNPQFWAVNRRFQAKRAYYQNYCIDSNQILHSDKDHQMPFVDGPHVRITNPRWRMVAILEKSKDCYVSAAVRAILTKFGTRMQFDPLDHFNR